MSYRVVSLAERPDLRQPGGEATADAFPAYAFHDPVIGHYWPRVLDEHAAFQFHLLDGDEIAARACSIPTSWDGRVDGLPDGIDDAIARAFDEAQPNVLCALLIAVAAPYRGRRVSSEALKAMVELARGHGLDALIAPVRPTWKERYPLTPIERYAAWRREDGLAFDPWIRLHERFGGRILKPAPRSARFAGTVAEWEEWTGLPFPESGEYVFPRGLATVQIDREHDVGSHWEPNVWMRHRVPPASPT